MNVKKLFYILFLVILTCCVEDEQNTGNAEKPAKLTAGIAPNSRRNKKEFNPTSNYNSSTVNDAATQTSVPVEVMADVPPLNSDAANIEVFYTSGETVVPQNTAIDSTTYIEEILDKKELIQNHIQKLVSEQNESSYKINSKPSVGIKESNNLSELDNEIDVANITEPLNTSRSSFLEGQRRLQLNEYREALASFKDVLKENSDNPNFNYLVGLCHFNLKQKKNSIAYFKKAIQATSSDYKKGDFSEKNTPSISYYYLGKAFFYNHQFDEAIYLYEKYSENIIDTEIANDLEYDIQAARNARQFVNGALKIKINKLGDHINTEYDEHSPVINAEENILIYTSRQKGTTGSFKTVKGKYFEDIYISKKENNEWSAGVSISSNINTIEHEASIGLSADGNELFIYKDVLGQGDLFSSKFMNDQWSIPAKLGANINSDYNETHACISSDGQTLYFVSDRPGGFGGRDIYIINKLPNGQWGWARNAGSTINSSKDEGGPFIHPDGKTLYFSSKGHQTMGGYDLFYSKMQPDSSWIKPQNIGHPINTVYDDIFYTLSTDGKRAYYSSSMNNEDETKDIYIMNLLSLPERSFVVVNGFIRQKQSSEVVKDVVIEVTNTDNDETIGIYQPNIQTGKYLLVLECGKEYKITSLYEDVDLTQNTITIPKGDSYFYSKNTITLDKIAITELR